MSLSISGKTAIVTGAGSGLGLAIARRFIDEGANVVLADPSEKKLKTGAEDLLDRDDARIFAGDLCERLTVANLLSVTLDAFDRVDILVNAARDFTLSDPLDTSDSSIQECFERNLMAGLRLSQIVARRMIAQAEEQAPEKGADAGCILSLGSIAAQVTQPQLLGWSIASAGVEAMTRALAVGLAPHQIRVNCIAVGSVLTASLREQMSENGDYRAAVESGTPLRRLGTLAEVTGAAQFLCSPAAGFVTGQVLTIDGGRSITDPVQRPAH